jgi:peptidoglycan-associated lipoprotein
LTENKDLKHDFILNPIPKDPIPMPDILYNLGRWELLPASIDSLQSLLKTMQDNPTLVIELRSHTDNRPIPMTNDTLSQRRAQSCVDYLIESGIDPERLVAKGYAERVPRTLERDMISRGVTFKKGTVLTREYINALKTTNEKEAAHDLNRRTEFLILRDDYVPKGTVGEVVKQNTNVRIVVENFIPVEVQDKLVYGTCYVNNKTLRFMIEPGVEKIDISYDQAMQFLKAAIIKVGDFELKEKAIVPEDGTIIDKSVVYLNTLRIGDKKEMENVEMRVIKGQKEPIVIGSKTFEEEFGSYTINAGEGKLIFSK